MCDFIQCMDIFFYPMLKIWWPNNNVTSRVQEFTG